MECLLAAFLAGDPCDTGCRDGATCSEDGLCEGGSSILTCSLDPGLDDECADVACVNGLCVTTFKRENLDCSDGNPFTCEDVCNDNGQCVGDADECPQDGKSPDGLFVCPVWLCSMLHTLPQYAGLMDMKLV